MPAVTLTPSAERERNTMEAGPPIRAESDDLGGFRRTDGQRPTRSDSAIGAINERPHLAMQSLSAMAKDPAS